MKHVLLKTCLILGALVSPVTAGSAAPLDQILATVPQGLTDLGLFFTDWAQIKGQLGLDGLTSESPLSDRWELFQRVSLDLAVASGYALEHSRTHSVDWGWDSSDLVWEANVVSRELPPVYVLRLRDDFDFSPVAGRFIARGFIQTESEGLVLYTHELDVRPDWIGSTELAILNTAYIPAEKTMILSSSLHAVRVLLATRRGDLPALAEDRFARAVAEHLDSPASGIILLGLGTCLRFTPSPILELLGTFPSDERVEELKEMIGERELLVPYRALGVGYRLAEGRPVGSIVFEYDTPELAALDLPARTLLAEVGKSVLNGAPIPETFFTVLGSRVRGSAAILTVAPAGGQPARLFRMILYRDAVFAGCSS